MSGCWAHGKLLESEHTFVSWSARLVACPMHDNSRNRWRTHRDSNTGPSA
jgi:hypothetical protein